MKGDLKKEVLFLELEGTVWFLDLIMRTVVAPCNQLRMRVSKVSTLEGDPWLTGMFRLKSQGWWAEGTWDLSSPCPVPVLILSPYISLWSENCSQIGK